MLAILCHFDGNTFVPDEPVDLPIGKVMAVVPVGAEDPSKMIVPPERNDLATASHDELGIGGWAHRTDIGDSVEYASALRKKVQTPRYKLNFPSDDSAGQ